MMMSENNEPVPETVDGKPFLMDSGSSAHTVNDDKHFVSYDGNFKPKEHAVTLADGTTPTGLALKKGTLEVKFRNMSGELVTGNIPVLSAAKSLIIVRTWDDCL